MPKLPAPLRGIVPPLVTPLSGRDQLDLPGLENLVERSIEAGCTGVFILGTTGEAPALSYRLREEMVRETCRFVRGRVPVLVGITDTSIVECLELGRRSSDLGADALVTAPPYYFRMTQEDLLRHAEVLARELTVPLFLYNIPGLTKLTYEPETVAAATAIENIVGVKDSSGDLMYLQRVIRAVAHRRDFSVLIGPEELLPQAISLGAHGGIAGGANLRPELYVQLYEAAQARRLDEVHDLQTRVMDLSERIYTVGDPATSYFRGLKCALELDGICSGLPAPPLAPFNDAERSQIAAHLQELSGSVVV